MKTAAAAAIAALTLAGCSGDSGAPPSATDPRDGRVTIAWSNCATGSCVYDWKACFGPDLVVVIATRERTVKDSPECEPKEAP